MASDYAQSLITLKRAGLSDAEIKDIRSKGSRAVIDAAKSYGYGERVAGFNDEGRQVSAQTEIVRDDGNTTVKSNVPQQIQFTPEQEKQFREEYKQEQAQLDPSINAGDVITSLRRERGQESNLFIKRKPSAGEVILAAREVEKNGRYVSEKQINDAKVIDFPAFTVTKQETQTEPSPAQQTPLGGFLNKRVEQEIKKGAPDQGDIFFKTIKDFTTETVKGLYDYGASVGRGGAVISRTIREQATDYLFNPNPTLKEGPKGIERDKTPFSFLQSEKDTKDALAFGTLAASTTGGYAVKAVTPFATSLFGPVATRAAGLTVGGLSAGYFGAQTAVAVVSANGTRERAAIVAELGANIAAFKFGETLVSPSTVATSALAGKRTKQFYQEVVRDVMYNEPFKFPTDGPAFQAKPSQREFIFTNNGIKQRTPQQQVTLSGETITREQMIRARASANPQERITQFQGKPLETDDGILIKRIGGSEKKPSQQYNLFEGTANPGRALPSPDPTTNLALTTDAGVGRGRIQILNKVTPTQQEKLIKPEVITINDDTKINWKAEPKPAKPKKPVLKELEPTSGTITVENKNTGQVLVMGYQQPQQQAVSFGGFDDLYAYGNRASVPTGSYTSVATDVSTPRIKPPTPTYDNPTIIFGVRLRGETLQGQTFKGTTAPVTRSSVMQSFRSTFETKTKLDFRQDLTTAQDTDLLKKSLQRSRSGIVPKYDTAQVQIPAQATALVPKQQQITEQIQVPVNTTVTDFERPPRRTREPRRPPPDTPPPYIRIPTPNFKLESTVRGYDAFVKYGSKLVKLGPTTTQEGALARGLKFADTTIKATVFVKPSDTQVSPQSGSAGLLKQKFRIKTEGETIKAVELPRFRLSTSEETGTVQTARKRKRVFYGI